MNRLASSSILTPLMITLDVSLRAAAEDTIAFWQDARNDRVSIEPGQWIECFPTDLYDGDSPMLVRDAYKGIAATMLEGCYTNSPDIKKARSFLIRGTPGIGKSVFASYLVACLGHYVENVTVVYYSMYWQEDGVLVFTAEGPVGYIQHAKIIDYLCDIEENGGPVWIIMDNKDPGQGILLPKRRPSRYLVTITSADLASSTDKWIREWDKHVDCRLLMPAFSLVETEAVARRYDNDEYDVRWSAITCLVAPFALSNPTHPF